MVLLRWLHRLEDALIVVVLLSMVVLAVTQILLRNLNGTSLMWVDPLLQNGVLWIGMLGAMIASRNDSHIRIDLASHYLSPAWQRGLSVLVDLFTSAVCAVVAWFSLATVREEATLGLKAFGSVPSWWLQGIIPLGFALIALRYAVLFVLNLIGRRPGLAST